ncbi:MAG TPA: YfiR family protein [Chitinophagaceae bacterium]|nr:YfiR family protein [Chitinophagaceae bacterium]
MRVQASIRYRGKNEWLFQALFILLFALNGHGLPAQPAPSREYQLKAVFLFNFTQFVDWPPTSFDADESPLVIGILGANPFGSFLEETVSGEKINGHPVTVHYCQSDEDAQNCHLLFVNLPDVKKRKAIITTLKGKNVLTVSDASDFSKLGGMIKFFTSNNKIKLQVNLEATKESELVLSSKLLRLAEIFKSEKSN